MEGGGGGAAAAAAPPGGMAAVGEGAGGAGGAPSSSIVDVIVVHGSEVVPEGYSKIMRSSGGKRADLNTGAMGQYVYLAVRKKG